MVQLTGQGLALFDQVAPVHLANEDRLLAALTGDERLALAGLLRRLLASFETHATDVADRLGSVDLVGTTRHVDIEVVAEPIS